MGGSRSGRNWSSQKQLSALMACPGSLPFRKKGAIKMMNGCPVTPLMAEDHKPLLGYVQATQDVKEAGGWPGFPGSVCCT